MVFWLVVAGVVGVLLAVSWRFDRRHRGQVRIDLNSPGLVEGEKFAMERNPPPPPDVRPF